MKSGDRLGSPITQQASRSVPASARTFSQHPVFSCNCRMEIVVQVS
jgi:hypothetical protein